MRKMNDRTRTELIAQMRKTQKEFDVMKEILVTSKMEQLEDEDEGALCMEDTGITLPSVEPMTQLRSDSSQYPIICSSCGKNSTVPFKPQYNSKVFCPECFKKNNGRR